jgi:hypothetical protein
VGASQADGGDVRVWFTDGDKRKRGCEAGPELEAMRNGLAERSDVRNNARRRGRWLGIDSGDNGVPEFGDLVRAVRRLHRADVIAWEFAAQLARFRLNTYVTLTWSDEAAERMHVAGASSAVRAFKQFMRDMGVRQFFVAVEGHKNREVPHVHAVVQYHGQRTDMWKRWWELTKSMAKVLPVEDGCLSYVTKYIMKDRSDTGGFTTDWCLWGSRGFCTEGNEEMAMMRKVRRKAAWNERRRHGSVGGACEASGSANFGVA